MQSCNKSDRETRSSRHSNHHSVNVGRPSHIYLRYGDVKRKPGPGATETRRRTDKSTQTTPRGWTTAGVREGRAPDPEGTRPWIASTPGNPRPAATPPTSERPPMAGRPGAGSTNRMPWLGGAQSVKRPENRKVNGKANSPKETVGRGPNPPSYKQACATSQWTRCPTPRPSSRQAKWNQTPGRDYRP